MSSRGQRFRKYFKVSVDTFNRNVQATEIYEVLKKAGIEVVSVELKEVK